MSRRTFRHGLDDRIAALDGIAQATSGKTFADYESDWLLKHAVERGIEIISEASRLLPEDVQARHPEIPWRRVRGIGNVLRHEDHGLANGIVWGVVVDELPRLRRTIQAINAALDGSV